jgi:hypothetical protein
MLDEQYGSRFPPPPLHVFSIFSRVSPESLPALARREKMDFDVEALSSNLYEISAALRRRFVHGYIVPTKSLWTLLIRPSESSALAEQVSRIALRNLFPDIAPAQVESEQLLDVLDGLANEVGSTALQVKDYFLKSAREGTTKRAWPRGQPYLRKKIEEEMGRKFLLDAISFIVSSSTTVEARVGRDGHFVLYGRERGCYSAFSTLIYQPVVETAVRNRKRFDNRGRKVVEGEPIINPIRIDPGIPLEGDSMRALKLTLISKYSSAVIHDTNPWLLVNTIDRRDGSYYDVYGYRDQIVVVPFERASADSLTRLYTLIRDLFPSAKLSLTSEA